MVCHPSTLNTYRLRWGPLLPPAAVRSMEAAEARYAQLGATYMQAPDGGGGSRERVSIMEADTEMGELARAAAAAAEGLASRVSMSEVLLCRDRI